MSDARELWQLEFLGNALSAWGLALATFLVTFTVLPLIKSSISVRRRQLGARGLPTISVAIELTALLIERTSVVFIWAVALWLASRHLAFDARIERWITVVAVPLFWWQAALWAMAAVRYAIDRRRQRSAAPDTLLRSSMEVILFAAGLAIWATAGLLTLANLGVQIAPLLAGLGVGGIALALAVQTVLGDLLASLSIALDKPFGLGDFLVVDSFEGTVEHVGVKSTRLRSLSGEQIIISNSDILKARVRNYGRMRERRAAFQLGVDYATPVAALAAIPRAVREVIEATPDTRFDRCHLMSCGDRALQFEVVYFLTSPDFNLYADAQQRINLRILERFRAMEVNFAAAMPKAVQLLNSSAAPQEAGGQQRLL